MCWVALGHSQADFAGLQGRIGSQADVCHPNSLTSEGAGIPIRILRYTNYTIEFASIMPFRFALRIQPKHTNIKPTPVPDSGDRDEVIRTK